LRAARWILREPGSGTRAAFESALTAMGVDPRSLDVALTLPSNEAVRSAVMEGRFATVLSELVVAAHVQSGVLARANLTLPGRQFFMLRHAARYRSKASLALEQLIRAAA
jgi:DNA-binding transcriptional LysR family regulator